MRILIAGAGIAGLTLAALLLRRGHDVTIFERSRELSEIGAGIQISANAGHVLHALGLGEALLERSFRPQTWHMRTYLVARDFTRLERLEPIRSSGSPAER